MKAKRCVAKRKLTGKLSVVLAMLCFSVPCWATDSMAGLSDPTRPDAGKRAIKKSSKWKKPLILQSTLVSPERRSAIINGQEKTTGSMIQGYEIVAIEPYRVLVRRDGKTSTLSLLPDKVVTTAQRSGARDD